MNAEEVRRGGCGGRCAHLGHECSILAMLKGLKADIGKGCAEQVPLASQLPAEIIIPHQFPSHQSSKCHQC